MTAQPRVPFPRGAAAPPPDQRRLRGPGRGGACRLRHPSLRPHLADPGGGGGRPGLPRRSRVRGSRGGHRRGSTARSICCRRCGRRSGGRTWTCRGTGWSDLFVFPGLVACVLLWAVVRLMFRRTGVGGVLRRMKARPPRSGDLAEQRLANLVQEVAVAAAVPPPRVLLIDAKAANVGAAGLTMDDATVVVTRGFVDRLPRDAQQAVIAHVMASIGNGDLILAAEILTLLQAWGLVSLMLEAPLVSPARASLMLVGRTALDTLRGRADASSRELAVDTLLAGADVRAPGLRRVRAAAGRRTRWCSCSATRRSCSRSARPPSRPRPSSGSRCSSWARSCRCCGGPAGSWRTRRPIQLTRYPAALADAYRTLAGLDMKVPGAVEVHFLFPVWDPAVDLDQTRQDVTSAADAHAARRSSRGSGGSSASARQPMVRRWRSRTRGTPGSTSSMPRARSASARCSWPG